MSIGKSHIRLWKTPLSAPLFAGLALSFLAPLVWFNARPSDFAFYWGGGGDSLLSFAWIRSLASLQFPLDRTISPYGLDWSFYPVLDWSQGLAAAFFDRLCSPGAGLVIVYILSFPLTYLLAFFSLRELRIDPLLSLVIGLSITFLPWHFYRLGHLFLATSYGYMAGILLVLRLANRKRISLSLVWPGVLAACSGLYFAAFTVILLVAHIVRRALQVRGQISELRTDLSVLLGFISLILVTQMPYWLAIPTGESTSQVSQRLPSESILYGGRLFLLYLPSAATHIPFLKQVISVQSLIPADTESALPSNYGSLLSAIAMFVISVVILVKLFGGIGHSLGMNLNPFVRANLELLSTLFIFSTMFFMSYGVNVFFAYLFTPQIRAWNRLTPIILTLSLLFLALLIQELQTYFEARRVRKYLTRRSMYFILLGVVLLDQMPTPGSARGIIDQGIARTSAARSYLEDVSSHVEPGCPIYQMPNIDFPENPPVNKLPDYELLFPAILDPSHKWSYATMKNTAAAAELRFLRDTPVQHLPSMLSAKGFCAIHYDARAYETDETFNQLVRAFGPPISIGFDDQWRAFRVTN